MPKRREGPERVAADVARDDGTHAVQLAEDRTMGAAGAQRRRTSGYPLGRIAVIFEDIFRSDAFATMALELGMDVIMIAPDYPA